MRCPSCTAENAATRRFCAQCGAALPVPCRACGFENETAARFCGGCGRPIGEIAAQQPPSPSAAAAQRYPREGVAAALPAFEQLFLRPACRSPRRTSQRSRSQNHKLGTELAEPRRTGPESASLPRFRHCSLGSALRVFARETMGIKHIPGMIAEEANISPSRVLTFPRLWSSDNRSYGP